MSKINTHLDPKVHVNKYSFDIIEDYELDKKTEWVNDLLVELEEDNEDKTSYEPATMKIKAQITRKTNNFLNDHLIVRADLEAHFHLPCGRCLYPLPQELNLSLSAAFLHESQENKPEYAEVTTVFADGQEMELYFYHKGLADIKEFLHEQIYIEVEPFPRCEGECKNPVLF
ncbi:MAG: YceD family protein [Bacteriovorax sp.]